MSDKLSIQDYTIFTLPERLEKEGYLFESMLTLETDISKAIDLLNSV